MGGHSCYEGGHRAHGGSPSPHTRENPVGGCSVHRGDIMIHVGDTMSTSGDFQYIRGILFSGVELSMRSFFVSYEYIRGYHEYTGDVQYIGVFNRN